MKRLLIVCMAALTTPMAIAESYTMNGYTYTYGFICDNNWQEVGIDILPKGPQGAGGKIPSVSPHPSGDFVIPDEFPDSSGTNFLPVVNIGYLERLGKYPGKGCAMYSDTMTSVVIPNTVTNIALAAFAECTELALVRFPKY